ncbi:N-acetyl-alpha-D-glucosaminyl L-malate synthase BshA [Salicibibacter halophilus]|uniref:N-acetyl-alpha-D-glucosaminyl L-malate synthase BshA n=1 Tax=Salicibibacter halophilus TaxID=2502791 RepID=A0A514LDP0_9BACI|nr:N-acetyl-alpha-D-glucosaminyl L-malate synthase BshA [Salicibibacter halophilus]QDI89976.1 N-acetyl-alpha-D-glucosaminyl L-malate synthase BshA [Salicibibacter halophilus]
MRTLKIGITCYPTVGGSGVVATELGKRLAEKGHEIHFITSSLPFRLERAYANIYFHEVEVNQYQIFRYPPYDLTLASKMAEVTEKHGLDLLHVHYAVPHAVSAALAKDMSGGDVKVMTTLHGTDITVLAHDPSLQNIIRYGINRSDKVTAVSRFLVNQTRDQLDISRHMEPIYNFVPPRISVPANQHALRRWYGIKDDEDVIVHMSNFRPVKRVEDVIQAFCLIRKEKASKLLLIGDGQERHSIEKLVEAKGLYDDVLFLGNQSRIYELVSLADVMLLLSEKESFGLTALEAMAVGVPVIGTNIGGLPEVISDGETGIICPVYDYQAAARAALSVLNDQAMHRRMADAARARAFSAFNSETIVANYENLYAEMLELHEHHEQKQ